MASLEQKLTIAKALEELVTKAIRDFEFGMKMLHLPMSIRATLWDALCRRAMAKVIECEKEAANATR